MIEFRKLQEHVTLAHLGYIPSFLSEADPRPAKEQFEENYSFGGWQPMKGFKLNKDMSLKYPGDPPMKPWAEATLRQELIYVYQSGWVMILQPDMSFEVARLD